MHHNLALLTNITVALLTAFAGGYLARRIGLPSLVGYLLAGMAIGPFTPGFVGEIDDISQLAEMGVIFMMFGVGLHFSLQDLWRVRRIAIPGAILQMLIATGLGFLLTQWWGWSIAAGLVLGLAISIASTVVLLRGLMDHGLLNTPHGQVAVGWLVLEDLATVAILVLLPAVLGGSGNPWQTAGIALFNTAIPALEQALQKILPLWRWLQRGEPTPQSHTHSLADHGVVVGYGRVGEHIVTVLKRLGVPYLVIEKDAARAASFQQQDIHMLWGDAANSELLTHTNLAQARALVVTIPDETATELIVTAAHDLAPTLPTIVRAATPAGVRRLAEHGAQAVIQPELEGGLEVVRHTLLALAYPLVQVQQYIDAVRNDAYDTTKMTPEESIMLDQLVAAVRGMAITWQLVGAESSLIGQTLVDANLRAQTGASIIALVRDQAVIANPEAHLTFAAGDLVGLIGTTQQVTAAAQQINPLTPVAA